jgi:hypothetical protein
MAIAGSDRIGPLLELARVKEELARVKDEDHDETRRLLYMALVVRRTKKYNLAGTLINALRHHQGVTDADLEDKVIEYIEGTSEDDTWLRGQIQRINDVGS